MASSCSFIIIALKFKSKYITCSYLRKQILQVVSTCMMKLGVVLNYETKSKRNERNETKRNITQRNILKCETKRNETKYTKMRNATKYTKMQNETKIY